MSKFIDKVNWNQLKKILGKQYSQSPLSAIEKNEKLNKHCEVVYYAGWNEIFSTSSIVDAVYILLKGMVGIGDIVTVTHDGNDWKFYVQNATLTPFSFIGEIEIPIIIENIGYPGISPQQHAWVSSAILSKLIAFHDNMYRIKIPADLKSPTISRLLPLIESGYLHYDDFKTGNNLLDRAIAQTAWEYHRDGKRTEAIALYNAKLMHKSQKQLSLAQPASTYQVDHEKEKEKIRLPSEKDIFSRDSEAILLRIPNHDEICNELWNDKTIRRYLCEDAFKKSRKYWIAPIGSEDWEDDATRYARVLRGLFQHAEVNRILDNGELFILSDLRIAAITDSNGFFHTDKSQYNSLLREYGLTFEKNKDPESDFINNSVLRCVYGLMCHGPGGNKEIFKVGRVRNT